eukprot:6309456-Prymnesium_polylepis.1
MRPVQMARITRKVGVVFRSSVEQAMPRVRPVVGLGFEYSTMPGWGRSIWYGRCTLGGGSGLRGLGGVRRVAFLVALVCHIR